jgi:hypothetical protein
MEEQRRRWAKRLVACITVGTTMAWLSGCAVYGHHGRVRVGVALPAVIPIPIPVPRHEPQPEYPQPPPPSPPPPPQSAPPSADRQVYPSAGSPRGSEYAEYGAVRSIETSPYRGMVRVGVLLDNRGVRYVDLPGTNLRIGERVRMEGDRLYRD